MSSGVHKTKVSLREKNATKIEIAGIPKTPKEKINIVDDGSATIIPGLECFIKFRDKGLKMKLPEESRDLYYKSSGLFRIDVKLPENIYNLDEIREIVLYCINISESSKMHKEVAVKILGSMVTFKEFLGYAFENVNFEDEKDSNNYINKLACKYYEVDYLRVIGNKTFLDPRRRFINYIIKLIHFLSGERIKIITYNMYKRGCLTVHKVNSETGKISKRYIYVAYEIFSLINHQEKLLSKLQPKDNRRFFDVKKMDFKNPVMVDKIKL